jgi:Cellulase (glycosyl hydrolase family 5)
VNRRLVSWLSAGILSLVVCACSTAPPPLKASAPFATPTPESTSTRFPTATPAVFPTATPVPPPPFASTRITWQGHPFYLQGANLPWVNWGCDFGCGTSGGVSSSEVSAVASSAITNAKASGLNVIRWWMFPGEPSQFTVAADGSPLGLKPLVVQDIDAALRIAQATDTYFVFVLFSSPSQLPAEWIADDRQRASLAAVVGALAANYKENPHLLAWEVFNEPEWDIWGGKANQDDVVATVSAISKQIHAHSRALVTVGSANIEALGMWSSTDLDFFEPHWYDPMEAAACARCTDYATLRAMYQLNRPVVIGEFYADAAVDALQRDKDFYAKGYSGAWAWSLLPDRTADKLGVDLVAAAGFAQLHDDFGPRAR